MLRWSGAILATLCLYPLSRFLSFAVKAKPRRIIVAAPLPLSGYHAERDFLLFAGPDRDEPIAVSRTCTHLGCRVSYLEDRQRIECPCHQSRFSPDGHVLAGPAKQPLTRLQVAVQRDADGRIRAYVVTL